VEPFAVAAGGDFVSKIHMWRKVGRELEIA